jgi:hypothetical protein
MKVQEGFLAAARLAVAWRRIGGRSVVAGDGAIALVASGAVTIPVKNAPVQALPCGNATMMWTYDGTFPGPTIRRPVSVDLTEISST